jgi:hypothetical protein
VIQCGAKLGEACRECRRADVEGVVDDVFPLPGQGIKDDECFGERAIQCEEDVSCGKKIRYGAKYPLPSSRMTLPEGIVSTMLSALSWMS